MTSQLIRSGRHTALDSNFPRPAALLRFGSPGEPNPGNHLTERGTAKMPDQSRSSRETMVIVALEGGHTAYVTVRRGVIDSGSEALAHTPAERQQRGEIPAGRIVSAKPAR